MQNASFALVDIAYLTQTSTGKFHLKSFIAHPGGISSNQFLSL